MNNKKDVDIVGIDCSEQEDLVCRNRHHEGEDAHSINMIPLQETFHCVNCSTSLLQKHIKSLLSNETTCFLCNLTSRPLKSYPILFCTVKQEIICIEYHKRTFKQINDHNFPLDEAIFLPYLKWFIAGSLTDTFACCNKIIRFQKSWISLYSDVIILRHTKRKRETSGNRAASKSKRSAKLENLTTRGKDMIQDVRHSHQSLNAVDKHSSRELNMTDREKQAVNNVKGGRAGSLSRRELKKQHLVQQKVHPLQRIGLKQQLENATFEGTAAVKEELSDANDNKYEKQLKLFWIRQKLKIEGQYAYMSIALLVCIMLACLWCMRGFHNRNRGKITPSFNDKPHLLSVKEVLFRKARYLPMFHRDDGLEEVFVHDCGNDP